MLFTSRDDTIYLNKLYLFDGSILDDNNRLPESGYRISTMRRVSEKAPASSR
jgi:hypothetical protein